MIESWGAPNPNPRSPVLITKDNPRYKESGRWALSSSQIHRSTCGCYTAGCAQCWVGWLVESSTSRWWSGTLCTISAGCAYSIESGSISVSIHPSIHQSVHPFIGLLIHLSIYQSIKHSFNHVISQFIYAFIHLSVYPSIHPSIDGSIHVSTHLSWGTAANFGELMYLYILMHVCVCAFAEKLVVYIILAHYH